MTSAPSPIDWRRAEQVAIVVAARTPSPSATIAPQRLSEMRSVAEARVVDVTGLRAPSGGTITVIDRPTWIRANIATFQRLLAPLVDRWPQQRTAASLTGAITGAELGVLLGWMSTRVLGQFDLLVGGPDDDAVYLVGPNLARLEEQFGFDPDGFRTWVLLHELTHRAQFTGVPWMRDHFTGLVEQSVRLAAPDPAVLLDALRESLRDPATSGARLRDHGMIGLVAGPEQRAVLHRIGGLMSLLEGHGDVTMDRAAVGIVPDAERYGLVLRERRRRATPLARLAQRLLGFEAKLEQYAAGTRFIAAVEAYGGARVVDRCWVAPEMLPTLDEIRRPEDWLARCDVPELLAVLPDLVAALLTRSTFPPAGSVVTCAVSGGADSTALLALAVAAGCRPTAVHVDHGLRAGSARESEVVAETAARLGVPFIARRVTVPPGSNLEARARAARAAVLPPDVLTGHTADDQAETVLINLLRGAATSGLSGMRPGRRRPLLGLRRTETVELCRTLGLATVHDPSNDDVGFLRNRIRHELLPLLTDASRRDLVPVLVRQADLCRDDDDLLEQLAASIDPCDAVALTAAPAPLARRAVRRWLAAEDPEHHPPDAATVQRVLDVAAGRALACEVPGGHRVRRHRQRLSIVPLGDARTGTIGADGG